MSSSPLVQQLRQRLRDYRPTDKWPLDRTRMDDAAVLIAVTESIQPEIILTKRSERLSSHRGEVALPGGRIDQADEGVVAAALRESHEEVGLHPSQVEVLGLLDPMVTRFGVKVTPVVGVVPEDVILVPNPAELDAVFRVPLEFLLRDERLRTDVGTLGHHRIHVPCWRYESYDIWGVTAVILVTLMNQVYDRGIRTGMETVMEDKEHRILAQDWREVR